MRCLTKTERCHYYLWPTSNWPSLDYNIRFIKPPIWWIKPNCNKPVVDCMVLFIELPIWWITFLSHQNSGHVVNENDKNGLTVKWHFTWQKIEPYFWDTWDWNWILWGGDLESLPHKVQFHIKFVAICYSFAIISYKILHLLAGNVCYHVYIINIYTITNIPR